MDSARTKVVKHELKLCDETAEVSFIEDAAAGLVQPAEASGEISLQVTGHSEMALN